MKSADALREEEFLLKFHGKVELDRIGEMESQDRIWWIRRLTEQFKSEADALKGGAKVTRGI